MRSSAYTSAAQGVKPSGFDRGAAITRSLLGYGVVAGPFYLIVGLIQAFVRDGFDLTRHALSALANGQGGWVQTVNFVLSGAMVIAAAIGFARVLVRGKGRVASVFLAAFGASMIAAAVFPADPVDGFPIGTPEGMPTTVTTSGMLHFVFGGLGFTSLGVSCLIAAAAMAQRGARSQSRLSLFSGLAVILGFFSMPMLPSVAAGIAALWFSVVVGWTWLAVMSLHLYREAPDPNCAPASA